MKWFLWVLFGWLFGASIKGLPSKQLSDIFVAL